MTCPACRREVPPGANFCAWCGQRLAVTPDAAAGDDGGHSEQRAGQDAWSDRRGDRSRDHALAAYYREKFRLFDDNGGRFVATWNWASLIFGPFWYLYKGMWGKSLAMFLLSIAFTGIPAPFFWIYTGIFGNWDFYLFWRKNTQWWS